MVLGAPVDLSFDLQPDPGSDVASSCVTAKLAAGDNVVSDSKVRVVPLPEVRGRSSGVRVLASIALDEPVLTVTLTAGCAGKTTRTYTFLPDLPATAPRFSSASPVDISRLPNVPNGSIGTGGTGGAAAGALDSSGRTPANKTTDAGSRAKVQGPKPALVPPSPRTFADAKPPKNAPVASSEAKSTSPTRQVPVAAAARAGRARLVVEPLDTWLESPMVLRTTPELLSAPSQEGTPQRVQAAELWTFLNAQPEDLQKDAQRLKALEANSLAARQQTLKDQADAARLREQLDRAEQERFPAAVVYVLGALLLAALLAGAWIWTRLRNVSQMAVRSWRDSVDLGAQGTAAAHNAALGLAPHPADDWVPPEPAAGIYRPAPAAPVAPVAPAQFVATRPVASAPAPLATLKTGVAGSSQSLQLVNPEELFDIQQQAEFFISVGEHQQAIEVLKKHIATHRESSPLAYLELLRLYHTLSRVDDFSQLRTQFMLFFNAQVPEFSVFHRTGRGLDSYTDALAEIEAVWTTSGVLQLLETFLFRREDSAGAEPFDLAAYDDLLLLLSIAQTTPASARGALPPRNRTTPFAPSRADAQVDEPPSAVMPPADLPLDSLAASLEFDFDLPPRRAATGPAAPATAALRSGGSVSNGGGGTGPSQAIPLDLDLDLSEPVPLTLSDLPPVPVTAAPAAGQPIGFGTENDLMELRLELEQKKTDS